MSNSKKAPKLPQIIGAICVVMVVILLLPISSVLQMITVSTLVGLLVAFLIGWKSKD